MNALVAWKAVGSVTANAALKRERSQVYAVTVNTGQPTNPSLSLLMGLAQKRAHVRFAAVIYTGAANRTAGVAHGYVTGAVAKHCFGLNATEQARMRSAMQTALSKFKGNAVLERFQAGKAHGEVSIKLQGDRVDARALGPARSERMAGVLRFGIVGCCAPCRMSSPNRAGHSYTQINHARCAHHHARAPISSPGLPSGAARGR